MFIIEKFKITNEEWAEAMEIIKNTYYPVHDENQKIIELSNVPPANIIIEIVEQIRKNKAL